MSIFRRTFKHHAARPALFGLVLAALLAGSTLWGGTAVEANHPVLVEGNCDSPVPGTTIVTAGTCGDFDGDGRIGTAEDTDGADRIFGTIRAALGPGTGAAAGTGANLNGLVLIVTSGRFAEGSILIGNVTAGFEGQGLAAPGNVTIEAAPGVMANIDAVLQGDPAGGNISRQNNGAFFVNYLPDFGNRVVTFRNLNFRNYLEAIGIASNSRVLIDNCRFENNTRNGVQAGGLSQVVISRSQFTANGRRIGPGADNTPSPGDGLMVTGAPQVRVVDSVFSHNVGAGIRNTSGAANSLTVYKVASYLNGTDIIGLFTIAPNPNYSN